MNKENIISKLEKFQIGEFEKSITMIENVNFENDYIKLKRIDSSNKWLGVPHNSNLSKQWGIIIEIKKQFTNFEGYKYLQNHFDVDITPVVKGINKGCFGIRFYNMVKNPTKSIIENILNFIFENI